MKQESIWGAFTSKQRLQLIDILKESSDMIIKVDRIFNGGLRFTNKQGQREFLPYKEWTRKAASDALDIYEHVYGYKRENVKFDIGGV